MGMATVRGSRRTGRGTHRLHSSMASQDTVPMGMLGQPPLRLGALVPVSPGHTKSRDGSVQPGVACSSSLLCCSLLVCKLELHVFRPRPSRRFWAVVQLDCRGFAVV